MEEPRIGVYICWCGTNIAKVVDVERVTREVATLPNVVVAKNYKYMCSDPGQELIINDIKEHNLNRVVVSACSPRIHELTFRKALTNAGLNPYLFEMANIREHVSWVHTDPETATRKAKSLITAAVKRVGFHEPLDKRSVDINPATLVIGGGISGMSAALELANAGQKVYLVEKSSNLGGIVTGLSQTYPYLADAEEMIGRIISEVTHHKMIDTYFNTSIEHITGYVGNFETTLHDNGRDVILNFGNIIVATGLKPFDPSPVEQYGYGKLRNVITSLEFEKMLKTADIRTAEGNVPGNVLIIHCVGSRNREYHEYCSRTCCMTALKYSAQIKSALPETNVFHAYADMRAFGKACEEMYAKTASKGAVFMMFDQQADLPVVRKAPAGEGSDMLVKINEKLSGEQVEVPADLIVLMTAMEAHNDAKETSHVAGISMCGNSFFIEKHPKLDPVATTTDGVFIAGACQAPKDIPDSVSQAKAAAARVLANIARGTVEVELTTAHVNEEVCCGCQTCISVCPYSAISFDEEKRVSVVNEILCKGCGTCGSACPTGAIRTRHFTDRQILSQIEGLLSLSKSKSLTLEMEEA